MCVGVALMPQSLISEQLASSYLDNLSDLKSLSPFNPRKRATTCASFDAQLKYVTVLTKPLPRRRSATWSSALTPIRIKTKTMPRKKG